MNLSGSHHAVHHRALRLPLILSVVAGVVVLAVLASILLTRGHGSDHRALAPQSNTALPATSALPSSVATGTTAPEPGATTTPPSAAATPAAPLAPITYVVKPGDNLTVIAAWFQLHGYGSLYQANKAVLGDDPSLIHPGQKITIAGGGMSTSG